MGVETVLVRVLSVRSQNAYGAIFRAEEINLDGVICDPAKQVVVRTLKRDLACDVKAGQWWSVTGEIETVRNPNGFGGYRAEDQMDAVEGGAEMLMPEGRHIIQYLAGHPEIKQCGEVRATDLWEAFQDKLFDLLDAGDVTQLSQVVSEKLATNIVDVWAAEGLSAQLQWLQSNSVKFKVGRRALAIYGPQMIHKIKENPYRLLPLSASWGTVDKLALGVCGLAKDDPRRLEAAVHEACYGELTKGNTYVESAQLKARVSKLLDDTSIARSLVEEAIAQAVSAERLLLDRSDNAYTPGAYLLERNVVEAITGRLAAHPVDVDVDGIIRDYEQSEGHGFALNKEQREAVHMVAENNFSVLTGGAGCGKTTVLKVVFTVLEEQGYEIVQLALAGKAAKRISESTGRPASTIAAFVGAKSKEDKPDPNQTSLIDESKVAVVIDEASMVDLLSMNRLLRHIPTDCKIVLVGDPNQLPPVGPGLILHCLVGQEGIPHTHLLKSNRFGNDIASIADSVRDGQWPEAFNEAVRFVEAKKDEVIAPAVARYLEDPENSVVLCARRAEVDEINRKIQSALTLGNKELTTYNDDYEMMQGERKYLHDLVLCTRNRYDLGIQNGSIGRIVEIFDTPTVLDSDEAGDAPALGWIIWDDGDKRPIRVDLLDDLDLGYALTFHKSQGSQWKHVTLCLPMSSRSGLIDRSLVYTGITRAQSSVVIYGEEQKLSPAVGAKKTSDRRLIALPKMLRYLLEKDRN